jgi:hypothetical protein
MFWGGQWPDPYNMVFNALYAGRSAAIKLAFRRLIALHEVRES